MTRSRYTLGMILVLVWIGVGQAAGVVCDKTAAQSVLVNIRVLSARIDVKAGKEKKYYIDKFLWATFKGEKQLQLIESVADAHACLEGRSRQLQIIDSLTGDLLAEVSPTRWGRLLK